MASALLCTTAFLLLFGLASAYSHSARTPDRVSEADIQRLLHGVMEQLGIARPRVEYPAHQAMNLVGPQSIEGTWLVVNFFICFRNNYCFVHVSMQNIPSLKSQASAPCCCPTSAFKSAIFYLSYSNALG